MANFVKYRAMHSKTEFQFSHYSPVGLLRPFGVWRESHFGNFSSTFHDSFPDDNSRKLATHREDASHQ